MKQSQTSFSDIINTIKKYHPLSEESSSELTYCYNYLQSLYTNTIHYYNDIKLSIEDSLSIAMFIAKWHFNSEVVMAALLHTLSKKELDEYIQKSKSHFGQPSEYEKQSLIQSTVKTLESYRNIKIQLQNIKKHYAPSDSQNIMRSIIFKEKDLSSFYIEIAAKLCFLGHATDSKAYRTVAMDVRKILVPQIQNINAFNLADTLLELCLKVENPELYNTIKNQIQLKKDHNLYYKNCTLKNLTNIFDPNNKIISETSNECKQYIKDIKKFSYSTRTIYSIYRKIGKKTFTDIEKTIHDLNFAMYDLTLIIKDNHSANSIDIFFTYYNSQLKSKGLYVLNYCETTYKDSSYFILCDEVNNLYRFFIKTETEYLHYLYGDIIEIDTFSLPDDNRDKINVFKKDNSITTIPKGSSVLDFAFMLHKDLGLHFDYALLNNKERIPAYTQLQPGDKVEIKTKPEITAEIQWFRYLKNASAINCLSRYFNKEFSQLKKENEITIITKDGTSANINSGATALDFAFSIHRDMGLHFSYAIINGKKRHMPAHTVLNSGDHVIIYINKDILPNLQWFGYVKTDYATKCLIRYFKKLYES